MNGHVGIDVGGWLGGRGEWVDGREWEDGWVDGENGWVGVRGRVGGWVGGFVGLHRDLRYYVNTDH